MRTRMRAGLLAAGIGLMMTGCWTTTPNPATRNPNQNIPRQSINTGFQNNNPAGGSMNSGQPAGTMNNAGIISRTSGAPADPAARIGMTSGATAGAVGATGGMPYLNPPPAGNGVQPIATNVDQGAARTVQPVANINRGAVVNPPGDLDPPPGVRPQVGEKEFPAALSAYGLDKPPSFERKSPAMPADLPVVAPSSPPMPNKIRSIDPLDQLPPPPSK